MKFLKTSVLTTVAVGTLMLIGAGSAGATELTCTSPPGTKVMCSTGTVIHATAVGHVTYHSPSLGDIECNSTFEGVTTTTGGTSETVAGHVVNITFTGCTGPVVAIVLIDPGTFEIHTDGTSVNNNGTLTISRMEVTMERSGFHCIFKTSNTDVGTITGSSTSGGAPRIDISGTIPRTGGRSGAFCGTSALWTGSYIVDTPAWMDLD